MDSSDRVVTFKCVKVQPMCSVHKHGKCGTSFFMLGDSIHCMCIAKKWYRILCIAFAKSTANSIRKSDTAPHMLTVLGHTHASRLHLQERFPCTHASYTQLAYLYHQCATSLLSRDCHIADGTVRHAGVERPFSSC